MLRSMTAYGRETTETSVGVFGVEILSVNRKHLDIQLQMPKALNCLDMDVRKMISGAIKRGQVTVRIFPSLKSSVKVKPNLELARQLYGAWKEIGDALGVDGFTLEMLQGESGVLTYDDEISDVETFKACVRESVEAALKPMLIMKDVEGKALQDDILSRVSLLKSLMKEIEAKAPGACLRYREKLSLALKGVFAGESELNERVLQEIAVFAEKVDIAEEIIRFKSHIEQVEATVAGNETTVGKTLEFLLQELGREINTIGAKNSDIEVAKLVIDTKTELERIREQIQNVE